MTRKFEPDNRGILTRHRMHTKCCGGVCLTDREFSSIRQKAGRLSSLECPVHGVPDNSNDISWDSEWTTEFIRIGVKPKGAKRSSSEVTRHRQ